MPAAVAIAVDPKARLNEAIKSVTMLATLPEITSQIIQTIENPQSSAGGLHSIISHDPALVTRILKVVNSAFYGLPGQVGSVQRAIVLLGLNAVKNIAVAASLGQLFRGVKLCEGFTARDLWTHCISVAVASRELAALTNPQQADEAFLAGMIHDIGIMVELQVWPEKFRAVCEQVRRSAGNFCENERLALGLDHQLVGAALAERWKFPTSCQKVAGFHHNPASITDDALPLVSMVHVADVLCCQGSHGFNLTALHQQFDPTALQAAKATPQVLETLSAKLPQSISNAMAVFG
jgi:HD-like signal output (HDOD) protein